MKVLFDILQSIYFQMGNVILGRNINDRSQGRDRVRTLSANRYTDFGDGSGISPSHVQAIAELLNLRFSLDPNGAKPIVLVYRQYKKAWKLSLVERVRRIDFW